MSKIDFDEGLKPCIEDRVKGKFIPQNFQQKQDSYSLEIYKQILSNASLPKQHMERIKNPCASDDFICGRASQEIYGSMILSRSFDPYGRCIKSEVPKDKSKIVVHPKRHITVEELKEQIEKLSFERTEKLTTPIWKIGFKSATYAPPGLAPPMNNILNSKGNEKYFSYDGSWKDGNMEGEGCYQFQDGSEYKGVFKKNIPDGYGQATYHGGTIYVGEWQRGYPHGKGRVVYQGGVIYDGLWKKGKRHGHGILSFPAGSYYDGGFCNGKFQGKGKFVSKGNNLTYVGAFYRGFVTGIGTVTFPNGRQCKKEWPKEMGHQLAIHQAITHIEKEFEDSALKQKKLQKDLHGTIESVKLEERVKEVRDSIKKRRKNDKEKKKMEKIMKFREKQQAMQNFVSKNEVEIET